jgi:hypothetical protein
LEAIDSMLVSLSLEIFYMSRILVHTLSRTQLL